MASQEVVSLQDGAAEPTQFVPTLGDGAAEPTQFVATSARNGSAEFAQLGSSVVCGNMIRAGLPEHLASTEYLRKCGGSTPRRFSLGSFNHFRRLTFQQWSHDTGFWWSCTFDPDLYFIVDPEDDCHSTCGNWERYIVEETQELCWVHGEAKLWFFENESLNDAGAGEPSMVNRHHPATGSTEMMGLNTEQARAAEP